MTRAQPSVQRSAHAPANCPKGTLARLRSGGAALALACAWIAALVPTACNSVSAGAQAGQGAVVTDPLLLAAGFTLLSEGPAPAGTQISARDLEGLTPGTLAWQVAPATGAPRCVAIETSQAPDGRWRRTGPDGTRMMAIAANGAVSMEEQTDAKDGATTLFEPALLLAPPTLGLGDEAPADSTLTIVRGKTHDRNGGRARRTARIMGIDRVRTPLGEFDAVRVETAFALKAPYASLRKDATVWVRPGTGPIATFIDERVLVMGVIPRDRREALVRMPPGTAVTATPPGIPSGATP